MRRLSGRAPNGRGDRLDFRAMTHEDVVTRAHERAMRMLREGAPRHEILTSLVSAAESVAGGGSTPGYSLPTYLLAITPKTISAAELAARLRRHEPPVIVRVEAGRVLLDLRTVFEDQHAALVAALRSALAA